MDDVETKDKIHELTTLLAELQPGFYPEPLFLEFCRLTASPIVEVVPLRKNGEAVEVLLLERRADDPVFAGQVHTPGTVIRPDDTLGSFNDAFQRLLAGELHGVATTEPVFVTNILHDVGRGTEASHIHWVKVLGEPAVGQWYPADSLPDNLVRGQLDFIPLAVEHFKASTSRTS